MNGKQAQCVEANGKVVQRCHTAGGSVDLAMGQFTSASGVLS